MFRVYLIFLGIPYTHSGVVLAIAMDKHMTKVLDTSNILFLITKY